MMKSKAQQALEFANTIQKHESPPRGTMDAGLYIGFLKGWEARDKELEELRNLVRELYKQALTN